MTQATNFIDELSFRNDDEGILREILWRPLPSVIQCPALCHVIHLYGQEPDTAVIFVKRDLAEILASQKRIGWGFEEYEHSKYNFILSEYYYSGLPSAAIKYDYWRTYQRERIPCAFEVDYRSLRFHPMWVPDEKRTNFGPLQTEEENGS